MIATAVLAPGWLCIQIDGRPEQGPVEVLAPKRPIRLIGFFTENAHCSAAGLPLVNAVGKQAGY